MCWPGCWSGRRGSLPAGAPVRVPSSPRVSRPAGVRAHGGADDPLGGWSSAWGGHFRWDPSRTAARSSQRAPVHPPSETTDLPAARPSPPPAAASGPGRRLRPRPPPQAPAGRPRPRPAARPSPRPRVPSSPRVSRPAGVRAHGGADDPLGGWSSAWGGHFRWDPSRTAARSSQRAPVHPPSETTDLPAARPSPRPAVPPRRCHPGGATLAVQPGGWTVGHAAFRWPRRRYTRGPWPPAPPEANASTAASTSSRAGDRSVTRS